MPENSPKGPASRQLTLPLRVEREREIDGVGMGVLSDGTPYLTARGIARMCGVDHSAINRITASWGTDNPRPRAIKENLRQQGVVLGQPHLVITQDRKTTYYAYSDVVCMAFLEYYAFDAASEAREYALKNFRNLARRSFREFIYAQVGYTPVQRLPESWQQFQDRVSLVYDNVPPGYFSIFKELADLFVTLIRGGADVGSEFIPDISVGQHWGRFWKESSYDQMFGDRIVYKHNYPDYFPQSASNPQSAHCYPDSALGEFRKWVRETYLPDKLPPYLNSKVRDGAITESLAQVTVRALQYRVDPKKLQ